MTGRQLKALRRKLKLTIAQAAEQCEVTSRTWSRWEVAKAVPERAVKLFLLLNKVKG